MTAPTEADRLAGLGATINLIDGSTLQIRFGFGALHRLETTFGSINQAREAMVRIFSESVVEGFEAPVMEDLEKLLLAGIGRPFEFDSIAEDFRELIALVLLAWMQAFPAVSIDEVTEGKADG